MHKEDVNKVRAANFSKDDLSFAPKPVSDNICHKISTYKRFLERNIDVVLSNASCVPRESSYRRNITTYNRSSTIIKERKHKRWVWAERKYFPNTGFFDETDGQKETKGFDKRHCHLCPLFNNFASFASLLMDFTTLIQFAWILAVKYAMLIC